MSKPTDTLIIDLDGTLSIDEQGVAYEDKAANKKLIAKLLAYKKQGFRIVIFTSRSMRSFNGDLALIAKHSLPLIKAWLAKHKVPYDELLIGKPWCGENGFYVDDRALRPSEFASLSPKKIKALLNKEAKLNLAQKGKAKKLKSTAKDTSQKSKLKTASKQATTSTKSPATKKKGKK